MFLSHEFWAFCRVRKTFRLFPIVVVIVLCGGLFVLTQGTLTAPSISTLVQADNAAIKFD